MNNIAQEFLNLIDKTILSLQEEFKSIRTGRATPALIENLQVETYGGQTKLKLLELATITTDGPSALIISPFDSSTIQDIEKAILKSTLGLSPQTQANRIVVKIPSLSQEQREKMIKLIREIVEEKREIIRNHRDESRKKVKNELELKSITEDQRFRIEKEIETHSQNSIEKIQKIKELKEKDILEV